jgi:hypothetical protein
MSKISVGFEFQTDCASVAKVRDGIVQLREEFVEYIQLDQNMKIYGDGLSNHKIRKTNKAFETKMERYEYLDIFPYMNHEIRLFTKDFEPVLNDMEFIVTYPNVTRVQMDETSVMTYIFERMTQALQKVYQYLDTHKPTEIQRVLAYSDDNKRGRTETSTFPYKSISIQGENVIFYRNPFDKIDFHTQVTIGVPVKDCIWFLNTLSDYYFKYAYKLEEECDSVNLWRTVQSTYQRSVFSSEYAYIICVLFHFQFLNMNKYKEACFVFRHLFKEILETLSNKEWVDIKKNIKEPVFKDYAERLKRSNGIESRTVRKDNEGISDVTLFPYIFDSLNTIILVEFRYFNRLL